MTTLVSTMTPMITAYVDGSGTAVTEPLTVTSSTRSVPRLEDAPEPRIRKVVAVFMPDRVIVNVPAERHVLSPVMVPEVRLDA